MSDSEEPLEGAVQTWLEESVAKGPLKMSSLYEPAGGAASLKTSLPKEQTRAPTELTLTKAAPGSVDLSPPKKTPLSGSSTVQPSALRSQLMEEEPSGPQESDRSERPPSPVFSVMSMKSDKSMDVSTQFKGQEKPTVMLSGQMQCDVSGCPNPAVKACLTCSASYCPACVRPHYCDEELERHQLQDLQHQGRCEQHNKELEFYCRTDQSAICSRCALHHHKGHDVIEQEETDTDQNLREPCKATRKGGVPPPGPIQFNSVLPNSVTVTWSPPEGAPGSCRYRVTWSRGKEQHCVTVERLKLEVTGLFPGETYQFTVATLTEDGRQSTCVEGSVQTEIPAPDNLCVDLQSTQASVRWKKPPGVERVYFLLGLSRQKKWISTVNTHSTEFLLSDLQLGVEHTVSVSTVLERGGQSKPASKTFTVGSELRVVLVGQERVGKSSAGNTILGKKEFICKMGAKPVTQSSERKEGVVEGRRVSVVDTPGLFSTQPFSRKLEEELLEAVGLSSPGPQVFLLILRLDGPTEQVLKTLETLKNILGPNVSKHTMVLFTNGDQLEEDMNMEQFIREDGNLQNLLKNCSGRYHVFNNKNMGDRSQVQDLLAKIDAISAEGSLCYEKSAEEKGPDLRIVFVGKTGAGKSAAGNTILGEKKFDEALSLSSKTAECKKETVEFAGQRLDVVDTPGLFDTSRSEEQIRIEIGKAICFTAPGPHVILIVIQLNRFTQEEQNTVKIIQEMFGEEINKYAMALFTHGDQLVNSYMNIDELICETPALSDFLRQCHGGYHVFNNRDKTDCSQVRELLKKINAMVQRNGGKYYSNTLFEKAEKAVEEKKRQILRKNHAAVEIARRLAERHNSFINGLTIMAVAGAAGRTVAGPVGAAVGVVGGALAGTVIAVRKELCTIQ